MARCGIIFALAFLVSKFGKAIGNCGRTGLTQPFEREKNNGENSNHGILVHFDCTGTGAWMPPLRFTQISIIRLRKPAGQPLITTQNMATDQLTASYDVILPAIEQSGNWGYTCEVSDTSNIAKTTAPLIHKCLREGRQTMRRRKCKYADDNS